MGAAAGDEGYEELFPLATGGMGELVVARRRAAGGVEKLVVLKQVRPSHAADPEFERMFLREAKIAASLDHSNVVRVYDSGVSPDGRMFLAMEYVHGVDLRALLRDLAPAPVPVHHALTVAVGVCAGLDYVHRKRNRDGAPLGLVHRDVSPSNILMSFDGAVKLTDFGVAGASADSLATRSGTVKGKLAYMAPEQARGDVVDATADVYALGAVLYEITTGQRPFGSATDVALLYRVLEEDPPDPQSVVPDYPAPLAAIVLRAMTRDQSARYQSVAQLQVELEAFAGQAGFVLSATQLGRYVAEICGRHEAPTVPGPRAPAQTHIDLEKVQSVVTSRAPRRGGSVVRLLVAATVGAAAVGGAMFALQPGEATPAAAPEAGPAGDPETVAHPGPSGVDTPEPDPGRRDPSPAARVTPDEVVDPADAGADRGRAGADAELADPPTEEPEGASHDELPRKPPRRRRRDRKRKPRKPAVDSPFPFGGS